MIAVSGGVDSVVCLDFLAQKHNVSIIHINHGTPYAESAQAFVTNLASNYGCPLSIHSIDPNVPKGVSSEQWWRHGRYEVFHSYDRPIITCHQLDDCVETWIWTCMRGAGKIIPFNHKNVVRPFRLNKRETFDARRDRLDLPWIEDPSNADVSYTRNFIRAELVERCLVVNPGLYTTVARKVKLDVNHTFMYDQPFRDTQYQSQLQPSNVGNEDEDLSRTCSV